MKTYLMTGCAGFIGSNMVIYMLKKNDDIKIINLDALTYAGNLENLKSVEGDERHIFVHGLTTTVIPVSTAEYGLSKAARPENSRLDKSKLKEAGFELLPTWQDSVSRYLKEANL